MICRRFTHWAAQSDTPGRTRARRRERCGYVSASAAAHWDEERVLDRYELLYEAGLIEEARRDGREAALTRGTARLWASRCGSITAASSPPRSRGCVPN